MNSNADNKLVRLILGCTVLGGLFIFTSCTPLVPTPQPGSPQIQLSSKPVSYLLPTQNGQWISPFAQQGRKPARVGKAQIEGIGEFSFDARQVKTLRADIFQPGHFSIFDALVFYLKKAISIWIIILMVL